MEGEERSLIRRKKPKQSNKEGIKSEENIPRQKSLDVLLIDLKWAAVDRIKVLSNDQGPLDREHNSVH